MQCEDAGADERKKSHQSLPRRPTRPTVKSLNLHSAWSPSGSLGQHEGPHLFTRTLKSERSALAQCRRPGLAEEDGGNHHCQQFLV